MTSVDVGNNNCCELFKPLEQYFKILMTVDGCNNGAFDCSELREILTKDNGKYTDNFLNALRCFAVQLKKADTPIGLTTIKNVLKENFLDAGKHYDIFSNTDSFVDMFNKSIINNIKDFNLNSKICNENDTLSLTYKQMLEKVITEYENKNKSILGITTNDTHLDNIFVTWINSSFDLYSYNINYFDEYIKNHKMQDWETKILDLYFNVKIYQASDGEFSSTSKTENILYQDFYKYRLNAIIDDDKAKILDLFPPDLHEELNNFLVSVSNCDKCEYVLQLHNSVSLSDTPFTVSDNQKLQILKNIKENWSDTISGKNFKQPVNNVKYNDTSTEYEFPKDFQVTNYQDEWRMDLEGNLYKKNDKGKYDLYKETDNEDEINKKLCPFEKQDDCETFFKILSKKENELAKQIMLTDMLSKNEQTFFKDYNKLIENLPKINPYYILTTLKAYGFKSYIDNGIVKFENFNNWWSRYHNTINKTFDEAQKELFNKKYSKKLFGGAFPEQLDTYTPPVPQNIELFFRLLLDFVNNNTFLLNPVDKTMINKFGVPKVHKLPKPPCYFNVNGKQIPNTRYEQDMALYNGTTSFKKDDSVSYQYLLENAIRNQTLQPRQPNTRLQDNYLDLNTILGLMIGVTNGGKIKIAQNPLFRRLNFASQYGGNAPDLPLCSKNATEIFRLGEIVLKEKNKQLSKTEKEQFTQLLEELKQSEFKVIDKLKILTQYGRVIKLLNNDNAKNDVTSDFMEKEIQEYEQANAELNKKQNSLISNMANKFGNKSFYGSL